MRQKIRKVVEGCHCWVYTLSGLVGLDFGRYSLPGRPGRVSVDIILRRLSDKSKPDGFGFACQVCE